MCCLLVDITTAAIKLPPISGVSPPLGCPVAL